MRKNIFLLLIILAAAVFLRLWQLDSIPPGLYPDVAINGNDALEALKTHNFKLFYPENNGREGLFMNLIALSFLIFGPSVWAIKIVAAIAGILTVFGIYLLARELFYWPAEKIKSHNYVAFLAAFFLATSFWHILFSRLGFRMILVPLAFVYSFYFLFKAFRTNYWRPAIFGGIAFGLGFYTYGSFRFAVLILGVMLVFWLLKYCKEKQFRKYAILVGAFLIATFLTALPIGIYFLQHPADFIGRAAGVSIFTQSSPVKAFVVGMITHLAMFDYKGDFNWRHNLAGMPMLPWFLGVFFLIGLLLTIFRFSRKENAAVNLFLISSFFIMLLPGAFTYEGIPHALRVVGVIPIVYIFTGLGVWEVYNFIASSSDRKKFITAVFLLFLLSAGAAEYTKYFYYWAENYNLQSAFSVNYVKIGDYLNSLPDNVQKYVIVNQDGVSVPWPNGIPMPAQTPMFIENSKYGRLRSTYLVPKNIDKINIGSNKAVIVLMQSDTNLILKIYEKFPQLKPQPQDGFWVFNIN